MKKIILDTNVLISFVTSRNPEQQEKADRIFTEAVELKQLLICHQEVLSEFVYVLQSVYKVGKESIHDILVDLVHMPGLEVVSETDFKLVLKLWPEYIADYGDSVLAALCKGTKNGSVATFDRKFVKELVALGIPVNGVL